MAKFVPENKLGKKARKELNRTRRVMWEFIPFRNRNHINRTVIRSEKARLPFPRNRIYV